jgi:hypothetical protein
MMAALPKERKRRLHPHERKRRRLRDLSKKRRKVTIAAGFKFGSSILFCADRKITTDVQTHESKIITRDYLGAQCGTTFTFAGDVAFARAAIQACETEIAALNQISSIEQIQRTIESALVTFYQVHIHPRPTEWESVDFELLIGIWLDGQTALFCSTETVLNEVDEYECIGAGAYLARYWVRQFYAARPILDHGLYITHPITLEEVGLIAACALRSVMEYDESCGGGAEYQIMQPNGQFGALLIVATNYAEFPAKVQAAIWRMMINLVRATDMSAAQRANERFFDEVRLLTESYKEDFDDLAQRLKDSVSPSAQDSPPPERDEQGRN